MRGPFGSERRFCHLCGRKVHKARVYRWHGDDGPGLVVCSSCEAHQPRCQVCDMPVASALVRDGLCPTCRAGTPTCKACGEPVGSSLVRIGDDGPYCESCHQTRPHCDVCGVPVGEPAWLLADGRHICDRCHQPAVYQPERGHELFDRTVDIVQRQLGLSLSVPTEFALVDRDQMEALLRGKNGEHEEGNTLGLFVRRGRRRGMYVEYGLPQILLIQVIAHEYAHAWQGENCPLLRDPLLREGFAEWVAYKVLQSMGATKKMKGMEERKGLYGDGLRHLLAIEHTRDVAGVLDYCRETS